MSNPKYTPELKLEIAKAYQSGKGSQRFLAAQYGVNYTTVEDWALKYKEHGELCFRPRSGNLSYSSGFKLRCVEAYLRGEYYRNKI